MGFTFKWWLISYQATLIWLIDVGGSATVCPTGRTDQSIVAWVGPTIVPCKRPFMNATFNEQTH